MIETVGQDIRPCPTPTTPEGISRRRFLGWGSKLVVGATALVGGLVKFTPTALADPWGSDPCDFCQLAGPQFLPDEECDIPCTGVCTTFLSVCWFGDCTTCFAQIYCGGVGCAPARVVVKCRTSYGSYFCGRYC